MYSAKILADSINEAGNRLTTFELTYPRFIHAQFMTHRLFSRNAASSRAIPTKKLIERIKNTPAAPLRWGKNQKGMQASEDFSDSEAVDIKAIWLEARDDALKRAQQLMLLGVHKQIANRILEPFMFITVIVSATEYGNFFHLRGEDAQPEIAWLASAMKRLYDYNKPKRLEVGQWHLPLVSDDPTSALYVSNEEVFNSHEKTKISVARCARVSYLTHDGERDIEKDLALYERLRTNGHWSPFEHTAVAMPSNKRFGNFFGFKQYRKFFDNEHFGKELD